MFNNLKDIASMQAPYDGSVLLKFRQKVHGDWWAYVLIAILVFSVLLAIHLVVKKINDTRAEERFSKLYTKTSTSTQVQTILLDKDSKHESTKSDHEDKSKKQSPPVDKVSLVFSIEDNTKRYSPYTCKINDSWTKFLGNKGVTIYSKDEVLKSSNSTMAAQSSNTLIPVDQNSNTVSLTGSKSEQAPRLLAPSFPLKTHSTTAKDGKHIADASDTDKDSNAELERSGITIEPSNDNSKMSVEPALCDKFLGAIYFKDTFVIQKPCASDDENPNQIDDNEPHSVPAYRKQCSYNLDTVSFSPGLTEVSRPVPSTDISMTAKYIKPILSNATSRVTLKKNLSKVTFKSEVSEVDVLKTTEKVASMESCSKTKLKDEEQHNADQSECHYDDSEPIVSYVTLLNDTELLEGMTHFKDKVGLKLMVSSEASTSKVRKNFKILVDHLTFCEDNIPIRFQREELDKELCDQIDGLQRYRKQITSKKLCQTSSKEKSSKHSNLNVTLVTEKDREPENLQIDADDQTKGPQTPTDQQ